MKIVLTARAKEADMSAREINARPGNQLPGGRD